MFNWLRKKVAEAILEGVSDACEVLRKSEQREPTVEVPPRLLTILAETEPDEKPTRKRA